MRTVIFLATFLFFSCLNMHAEVNSNVSNHHCLACEVPNGLVVNDLTGTSATLSWNVVTGATQYTIEVQDEQVNPSVFHLETNVAGNTFALTGLQSGVLYKFKVRARCGGDKSDWLTKIPLRIRLQRPYLRQTLEITSIGAKWPTSKSAVYSKQKPSISKRRSHGRPLERLP